MCSLTSRETLPDNTVVYGADCQRRLQLERPPVNIFPFYYFFENYIYIVMHTGPLLHIQITTTDQTSLHIRTLWCYQNTEFYLIFTYYTHSLESVFKPELLRFYLCHQNRVYHTVTWHGFMSIEGIVLFSYKKLWPFHF